MKTYEKPVLIEYENLSETTGGDVGSIIIN